MTMGPSPRLRTGPLLTSICQRTLVVAPKDLYHQLRWTGKQNPICPEQYSCVHCSAEKSSLAIVLTVASISGEMSEDFRASEEGELDEDDDEDLEEASATDEEEEVEEAALDSVVSLKAGSASAEDDASVSSFTTSVASSARMICPPTSTVGRIAPEMSTSSPTYPLRSMESLSRRINRPSERTRR